MGCQKESIPVHHSIEIQAMFQNPGKYRHALLDDGVSNIFCCPGSDVWKQADDETRAITNQTAFTANDRSGDTQGL